METPTIPKWVVRQVTPEPDFMLRIVFASNEIKRYDMKPVIADGGIFEKIASPSCFAAAYSDGTTVSWPGGVDIAPEELYANGVLCNE